MGYTYILPSEGEYVEGEITKVKNHLESFLMQTKNGVISLKADAEIDNAINVLDALRRILDIRKRVTYVRCPGEGYRGEKP